MKVGGTGDKVFFRVPGSVIWISSCTWHSYVSLLELRTEPEYKDS
jgi:hypothetical protein